MGYDAAQRGVVVCYIDYIILIIIPQALLIHDSFNIRELGFIFCIRCRLQ